MALGSTMDATVSPSGSVWNSTWKRPTMRMPSFFPFFRLIVFISNLMPRTIQSWRGNEASLHGRLCILLVQYPFPCLSNRGYLFRKPCARKAVCRSYAEVHVLKVPVSVWNHGHAVYRAALRIPSASPLAHWKHRYDTVSERHQERRCYSCVAPGDSYQRFSFSSCIVNARRAAVISFTLSSGTTESSGRYFLSSFLNCTANASVPAW